MVNGSQYVSLCEIQQGIKPEYFYVRLYYDGRPLKERKYNYLTHNPLILHVRQHVCSRL